MWLQGDIQLLNNFPLVTVCFLQHLLFLFPTPFSHPLPHLLKIEKSVSCMPCLVRANMLRVLICQVGTTWMSSDACLLPTPRKSYFKYMGSCLRRAKVSPK